MRKLALLLLLPSLAFAGTGTSSSLETRAKAAFTDISKAKAALDQGRNKSGESWLSKAKVKLGSLMHHEDAAQPQAQAPAEQSPSALSRAEGEAKSLDPSLMQRFGTPDQGASSPLSPVSNLQSTYEKVSLAQSLLHKGDSTQAKSVLDEIPTSPSDALRLLHH